MKRSEQKNRRNFCILLIYSIQDEISRGKKKSARNHRKENEINHLTCAVLAI
jgi:hypothetical protein